MVSFSKRIHLLPIEKKENVRKFHNKTYLKSLKDLLAKYKNLVQSISEMTKYSMTYLLKYVDKTLHGQFHFMSFFWDLNYF